MAYPETASHLRACNLSENHPENSFSRLAVASAMPSMTPIKLILTPKTLNRKRGRMLITISLEMSIKKLVRLTAHTLRGRSRRVALSVLFWVGVVMPVYFPGLSLFMKVNS